MPPEEPATEEIDQFIARWASSGGHERGAGQQSLLELCDLLRLPRPDPDGVPIPEERLEL